jgi:hypothetical protein
MSRIAKFEPKFCTVCGKELIQEPPQTFTDGFDAFTGEQVVIERRVTKCPDFQEYAMYTDSEPFPPSHDKHINYFRIK